VDPATADAIAQYARGETAAPDCNCTPYVGIAIAIEMPIIEAAQKGLFGDHKPANVGGPDSDDVARPSDRGRCDSGHRPPYRELREDAVDHGRWLTMGNAGQTNPRDSLINAYAVLISRLRCSAISRMLSGRPLPASLSGWF